MENPKASVVQNRIFRKRWSGFVISSSIVLLAVMTLTYLRMLAVAQISATVLAICWVVAIGYLIGYSGILAWKTGQGGSRISMGQSDGRKKVINRDDDHFWKAGLFYFNPDDPAVFVEKRYGVGFTMNFARRKAILVAVGILVLVLMLVVLSIVISTREF